MSSVTQRIAQIKQPKGGYLKIDKFTVDDMSDGRGLFAEENVHSLIVSSVVGYLTRVELGMSVEEAFKMALCGAKEAETMREKGAIVEAKGYLSRISGLGELSVINACKLASFDVWSHNTYTAYYAKPASAISPDSYTVMNITAMVERCLKFIDKYGPIVRTDFDFKPDGYTPVVCDGVGEFLTEDTIWDLRIAKQRPNSKHTLRVLMEFVMSQHSGNMCFANVSNIGIFNPRLNIAYRLKVSDIPKSVIKSIEDDVVDY